MERWPVCSVKVDVIFQSASQMWRYSTLTCKNMLWGMFYTLLQTLLLNLSIRKRHYWSATRRTELTQLTYWYFTYRNMWNVMQCYTEPRAYCMEGFIAAAVKCYLNLNASVIVMQWYLYIIATLAESLVLLWGHFQTVLICFKWHFQSRTLLIEGFFYAVNCSYSSVKGFEHFPYNWRILF